MILFALLGFLTTLFSLTLFGAHLFSILAIPISIAFFVVSFSREPEQARAFFVGLGLSYDLWGTAHFGAGLLFACLAISCAWLTQERLQLTSPIIRAVIGLGITLGLYNGLLFPYHEFTPRLILLLPALPVIVIFVISYYSKQQNQSDTSLTS